VKKILTYYKNRKGITVVMIALMLFVLLAFLGLAVDIAYMYFAKNQLQVAADGAALAGVANLSSGATTPIIDNNSSAYNQLPARQEAWRTACKNRSINQPVFLVTNDSRDPNNPNCDSPPASNLNETTNTITEDIVVGNWNGTSFIPATGSTNLPINALQARARRTGETPGMPAVRVFIGQIFRIIGADWAFMNARAIAIASRPPRGTAALSICDRTCTELEPTVTPTTPLTLYWAPYPSEVDPGNQGVAWTVFSESSQSTPTNELIAFFCGEERDACNLTIYSSNGNNNAVMRQFRCAFMNPLYDSAFKTCVDGNCNSSLDTVTSWKVIVPVFHNTGCPPGAQPSPSLVVKWAVLRIIQVYASGGGGTNECACGEYDAPAMGGPTPNAIIIDDIECINCSDPSPLLGRRAGLVK
jgi:Flp pilus assembly protein TadG